MSDLAGLGDLAQCMVDSDRSVKTRATQLRRRALAASVGLEAAVLGAVILWPLVTVGGLAAATDGDAAPTVSMAGSHEVQPISHLPPHTTIDSAPRFPTTLYQPPRIPPRIETTGGPEPPGLEGPPGPATPGIMEGFPDGQPIEIARPLEPPRPEKRVVRSGTVMEAMLVHRVEPVYPGTCEEHSSLRNRDPARADRNGRGKICATSQTGEWKCASGTCRSALEAVRQWRYRPTLLNGDAVEVETQITVNFVLNSSKLNSGAARFFIAPLPNFAFRWGMIRSG